MKDFLESKRGDTNNDQMVYKMEGKEKKGKEDIKK